MKAARFLKVRSALLVAFLLSASVEARQCLSWTLPTARENGTALDKSELSTVQIHYKRAIAKGVELGDRDLALKTRHCFNFSIPGKYEFSVAVTDKNKIQSAFSNVVVLDLVDP